ncbi:MAG: hypothetical protein NT136_04120 [Candidatus Moranbacteria bacterium]|nr:hypothetical protein [Candidatus Moranbacteria bacterium]
MNKLKFLFIFGVFSLLVLGMASHACAEVKIDINPEDDPLFDVKNAAPGYSKTKEVRAENVGTEAEDLYLNIDDVSNDDLADELKFYLTDKSSGKYFIGGPGDRFTLHEMDKAGDVFIERLEPGESNRYEVKVKFDEEAGNEFQDEKVKFDMVFGFGILTALGAPPPYRPGQAAGAVTEEGVTPEAAAEAGPGAEGLVAGEEECVPVRWWIFALILAAYVLLMIFTLSYRFQEQKSIRWFWQVIYTVLALIGWYYLDRCRTNTWFVYATIISGFAIYLAYLYFFRKKIQSGSDLEAYPPNDKKL